MFLCINNLINFIVNIFPKLKYFGYFKFNIYVILLYYIFENIFKKIYSFNNGNFFKLKSCCVMLCVGKLYGL